MPVHPRDFSVDWRFSDSRRNRSYRLPENYRFNGITVTDYSFQEPKRSGIEGSGVILWLPATGLARGHAGQISAPRPQY